MEDLLSQPQHARGSEKEQPKRDQFYEWLLGVLGKKNYNLSWSKLLNPLLARIHKTYSIFKSELCPSIFQVQATRRFTTQLLLQEYRIWPSCAMGISPGKTLK